MNKLDRLLIRAFPGAETELQPYESGHKSGKVGGFVIWPGFVEIDMRERVRTVWQAMERGLEPRDLKRIAAIIPFTPVEMQIRKEELALEENTIQRSARVPIS